MNPQQGPLEEPAGEWFVNRKRELDIFWKWASGIPHPVRNSYALLGLRRTGKTAILHKTFNRLFNEQDQILPIYITFVQYLHRSEPITAYEFVMEYLAGYIRSYLAFHYRDPELLSGRTRLDDLRKYTDEVGDELVASLFRSYDIEPVNKQTAAHSLMQWVINVPRSYAWKYKMPTAVFVDEFQVLTQVYNPDNKLMRNLTDSFQQAVETRQAPMLISGSSISMMVGDALGGLLSGRMKIPRLGPLSQEHAIDMVFRLSKHLGIPVTEELALAIWEITHGYPYAIESILNSDSPAMGRLPDVSALNEIVPFELTQEFGALWNHYESEYGKYVRQLNGDQTTRMILFWITNHLGERIIPEQVAEALDLDVLVVRESLEKLYRTDVIRRASISSFWGPSDPLMREFLRYEHYLDVEQLPPRDATAELRRTVRSITGEMNRKTGHFAEIIVGGVLNNFDDRHVDGETYFSSAELVMLPRMEEIVRREGVVKAGKMHEVDVIGEYNLFNHEEGNAGVGAWLVSVRYRKEKMSEQEIELFLQQTAAVQTEKQYGEVVRWYFSKAGFTEAASRRLQSEGIYHSNLAQFNSLASLFGLLPLAM